MPLVLPNKGTDYEDAPEGAHIGVCYRVLDLGTQDTTYLGQPKKSHLILVGWELPDERMMDGRPFTVHKRYTYSSSAKSNLRKDLESWRGAKFTDDDFGTFDLGKLIGVGCMVNIVREEKGEKTYTNVQTIMRLPKGTNAGKPSNPTLCFSLDDRPFDRSGYESLSDGLKAMIAKAPEYRAAVEGRDPHEEAPCPTGEGDYGGRYLDDEIPFVTCSLSVEPGIARKPIIL